MTKVVGESVYGSGWNRMLLRAERKQKNRERLAMLAILATVFLGPGAVEATVQFLN
jgi:hypothetical protein